MAVALDTSELRKARGAFFTPHEVCDFAVEWGIRSASDSVMEPSCGEAAFMLPAVARLRSLGSSKPRVTGFELHTASAETARSRIAAVGVTPDVRVGDFLEAPSAERFSVVLGNPPYVRYQDFSGTARANGLKAAGAQGVRLTNLASSWAPFVVHASSMLTDSGRLAMVLPAELLSSNYAAEVRAFLLRRFSDLKVILFDRNVFAGVQTEALLLLAEGSGGTGRVRFARCSDAGQLQKVAFGHELRPSSPLQKWTAAFVEPAVHAASGRLGVDFAPLGRWGVMRLGAVTGSNKFFTMTRDQATELDLRSGDVLRISPPGSAHLRALAFTRADYERLSDAGEPTLLFRPRLEPSKGALKHIIQGEELGVDRAFKCRVRNPWWRVPVPPAADLLFTYMNAGTPQLAHNPARLRHLNSVHGLYLHDELRDLSKLLALSALNSVTMLSAETTGRSYGGGILKMEPREALALAVPSPELIGRSTASLTAIWQPVRLHLQQGDMDAAVSLVDACLFPSNHSAQAEQVREARNLLAHRRATRNKSGSGA